MIENLRWIVCFTGVSVAVGGAVLVWRVRRQAGSKKVDALRRQATVSVLLGILIAWVFAQWPPFKPWGPWSRYENWLSQVPQPQVLIACVAYLAIVAASSRGLIGMPQYRQLQSRTSELLGVAARTDIIGPVGHREPPPTYWKNRIEDAEETAAYRFLGAVVSVPLPSVARAARTLNSIEIQILSDLHGHNLRVQARAIAANLPIESKEGRDRSGEIQDALQERLAVNTVGLRQDEKVQLESEKDQIIRARCIDGLALLSRHRDEPQEIEAGRIRVAMWLTLVGLVVIYVLSTTFPDINNALITGALGGMLGSLSALILRRALSLGLIVLAPVAGALNATGGLVLVSFLAQDEIQILGEIFRESWTIPTSLTSLAVALLLGFSGGLFARIAVAGTAPLLGTPNEPAQEVAQESAEPSTFEQRVTAADDAAAQNPSSPNGVQAPTEPANGGRPLKKVGGRRRV